MIIKKKSIDNYYLNQDKKKNYFVKNQNKVKSNKIIRSNSVGLLLNNNIYFGKGIKNKYNIKNLVFNNIK